MRSSVFCGLLLVLSLAVTDVSLPVLAVPDTPVTVRIEGEFRTIFEGEILTSGRTVTTASGGAHGCNGVHPTPVNALDDAAGMGGFTWDATSDRVHDKVFTIRIGDSEQTATQKWVVFINDRFITSTAHCRTQLQPDDEVLWVFTDLLNMPRILKLSGPSRVVSNQSFQVNVIDVRTGGFVRGVVVGGNSTDAEGNVTLTLGTPGLHKFKVERSRSVCSNTVAVTVVE